MGFRFWAQKAALAVFILFLASCAKKDWTCSCTVNGDDYTKTITNKTKSQASTACGNYGKSIGSQYGSYVYKCKVN